MYRRDIKKVNIKFNQNKKKTIINENEKQLIK